MPVAFVQLVIPDSKLGLESKLLGQDSDAAVAVAVGVRVGVRVAVGVRVGVAVLGANSGASGTTMSVDPKTSGTGATETVKPPSDKGEAPIVTAWSAGRFNDESETEVATANSGDMAVSSFAAMSLPAPERAAKAGVSTEPMTSQTMPFTVKLAGSAFVPL